MLKFPYAISDFKTLIAENYYYIDRTNHIPILESVGKQLLFLRPRRFGKSLLLNMLGTYYDVAEKADFQSIFGHLNIGKQPTEKQNSYFVMKWDFSAVLPMGNTEELKTALYKYLNARMQRFLDDYKDYLTEKIQLDDDALISFQRVLAGVNRIHQKLYLFIDEYDNFANEVMATKTNNNERYAELVYGEGLLKSVFKNIKIASYGNGLDRVFITGVSPIVMADMSSGYNVATNIYFYPEFNDLCGFQENEVATVLNQVLSARDSVTIPADEAMSLLKRFYNGYCFSFENQNNIYNPTLVLYFLQYLQRYGKYPENLLDHNLAMDRNRLNYVAHLPHGARVIENALDDTNPLAINKLHDRFGVEDMLSHEQQPDELASLLYYLGVLTLDGFVGIRRIKLKIPNLVIYSLYVEKLKELLLPTTPHYDYQQAVETFFLTADLQSLCQVIEQCFAVFSNRDYQWKAETAVKTAFLMFLFDDRLYMLDSELELQRQFADLTLIVRPDARQYQILDHVLEFKFVKLSALNITAEQVCHLSEADLKALPAVITAFIEAKQQLKRYATALQAKYGAILNLRCTAVVAVGFERLLWEKLAE